MRRKIFVNVHIPKCGGTTLQNIFKRIFKNNFHSDYTIPSEPQYKRSQFVQIFEHYDRINCFSSHKSSLDLPFDDPKYDITAITFVRDPIDRFFSHYFYFRNHRTNRKYLARELNLNDYIKYAFEDGNLKSYINGQTLFLSGDSSSKGLDYVKKKVKTGNLLIFPMKRMKESLMLLEKLYPKYFKDCSFAIENTSKKDQEITDEMKKRIKPYTLVDYALLDYSNEFLDKLLKENFSEKELKEKLVDFEKRSNIQEIKRKIFDGILNPLKKIKRLISRR